MGTLYKLTVAVAWVLWCTLSALATPEENGDFTMDMWLSPGGSVYMVVYSRLFYPRFLMETVLLRYLSDGRRVETHYLPGSGDSYALSGTLVPAPDRRGFFVVCEEGDRVWVARYLLPAQCAWVRTYKTPDTRREFSWDAGADAAGNLYVITHAEDSLPTFIKLDPHGRMLFSQKVNGYAEHLRVTASGESYSDYDSVLIRMNPQGKLEWMRVYDSNLRRVKR